MGKITYNEWLNGCGCQGGVRRITGSGACDCDSILLEISNLHTDDGILQDEIDELSDKVETLSGEVENKLDTSAYTPVDLTDYATKEWVEDKGYLTTVQPLKTINGESLVGEGNIVISGGSGVTIDAYTKREADERFQPIGNYALKSEIPSLSGYATQAWVENKNYLTEHQPLKTINGQVISGTGNIVIEASGTSVTVDDHLDSASTNPAQNKVIVGALNGKLDASAYTPTDLSNYYTKAEVEALISGLTSQIETLTARINNCCGDYPVSPTDLRYTGTTTANTEVSLSCCTEPGCEELVAHSIVETTQATGNLKTINVGECITIIGTDAFTGETNLTTVILPSTITYIRSAMLANCTSIQNLTLLATIPPTLNEGRLFGVEEQIPSGFKIYVPSSAVNTYKQASGWSTYENYIQAI